MKAAGIIAAVVLSAAMLVGSNASGTVTKDGAENMIPPYGVPYEIQRGWIEKKLKAREEKSVEDSNDDEVPSDVPVKLYIFRNSKDGTEFITSIPYVFMGLDDWKLESQYGNV